MDLIDRVALAAAAHDTAGIEAELRKIVDASPVQLWQDADPPLQPLVTQARRRLAALQGASG